MTRARTRCAHGGALLEAALTTTVLTSVVTVSLGVLVLLFARAWAEYASEQALYCLSEGRPLTTCRTDLRRRLERTPFVTYVDARLARRPDAWAAELRWRVGPHRFQLRKRLTYRAVLARAGLRS